MNRQSHGFGMVERPQGGEGGQGGGGGVQAEYAGRGGDEEMRKAWRGNERLPFIQTRSLCDGGHLQPGPGMVWIDFYEKCRSACENKSQAFE